MILRVQNIKNESRLIFMQTECIILVGTAIDLTPKPKETNMLHVLTNVLAIIAAGVPLMIVDALRSIQFFKARKVK
jgi:hypothetical protein